jgi:hypothetical protein
MQGALETHVGLCLFFLIFSHVKLASSPTVGTMTIVLAAMTALMAMQKGGSTPLG